MSPETFLKSARERVERRLVELLPGGHGETPAIARLHEAMRYAALGPGKRLRPLLCLSACRAVGGRTEAAMDAACAIEMVHCFSLVHDDLPALDDDDLRRGRPTLHKAYDEATAILAGDALFALAFETLAKASVMPARKVRAFYELTIATGSVGLVGGEMLDLASEGRPATLDLVESIHGRKTGALMAAACVIGGVCGRGDQDLLTRLDRFGREVGLAFQIADDLLNETAKSADLGKATGSDRARGKATFPALLGLSGARQAAADASARAIEALTDLPGDPTPLKYLAQYAINRKT